jgi:folate-binding protein YgfZ
MQNQWQTLLNISSPVLTTQLQTPAYASETGYLSCLTEFETLNITGPDRLTFLQGQMTCDFTTIEGKLLIGANCNLKGRASATFYAIDNAANETTQLILPTGQATYLKGLLDKYALFSKAELSADNEEQVVIGLIGEQSLAITGIASLESNQSVNITQGNVSRVNNTNIFLCVVNTELAQQWINAISENTTTDKNLVITHQNAWNQQQIASGISHVTTTSQDLFIPQELNYDLIDGISFTKGCYKGQEIIARLHYRGSYKQRTCRFQCKADAEPIPGTSIFGENTDQPYGQVIQSASTNDGIELLAVMKVKALESETFHLNQKDGPILHGLTLPYAITNEEE